MRTRMSGVFCESSWGEQRHRVGSREDWWEVCVGAEWGGGEKQRSKNHPELLSLPQQKSLWQLFDVQFALCPHSEVCRGTWVRTDSAGPFYSSVRQIASFPYLLKETGRKNNCCNSWPTGAYTLVQQTKPWVPWPVSFAKFAFTNNRNFLLCRGCDFYP